MAKARSVVADYLAYLLLRFFVCVVQAMPLAMGQWLAGVLAWSIYHLDKRHREVALDNLRHAFKDQYTEPERDKLVRAVFRHFCSLAIEIIHLPRCAHANNWRKYLELPQAKLVCGNLLSNRPRIFVTSHFGNWELTGFILGATGFKISSIARTLDNPFVDHFLRVKFRQKTGQQILSKDGDFDRIQQVLASGGVLGTLGDQDAGKRGLFVDFFGRPASTHKAIALLTIEHGAILTVSGMAQDRLAVALQGHHRGRDPSRGIRRQPRCGPPNHPAIHIRPGTHHPAPSRTIFLAAPPLETSTHCQNTSQGGVMERAKPRVNC